MDTLYLHAPLGNHICRNRRVNATTEQAHSPSANAGGKATCTGLSRTMDISSQITHFHIHRIGRLVHVYLACRMSFRQSASDFPGNLYGVHRETLIGTFGFHLKGRSAIQIVTQVFLYRIIYLINILIAGAAAAQAHQAKNAVASLPCAIYISHFVHRLHIYCGLHQIHIKIAVGFHTAAHILPQLILKLAFICAFQHNFTQF